MYEGSLVLTTALVGHWTIWRKLFEVNPDCVVSVELPNVPGAALPSGNNARYLQENPWYLNKSSDLKVTVIFVELLITTGEDVPQNFSLYTSLACVLVSTIR